MNPNEMGREIIEDVLAERVEELTALYAHSVFEFRLRVFHWHCYPLAGSRTVV